MADKKTGEENVRKIQRTGADGASYMVTLPKRIIKRLGCLPASPERVML